MIELIDFNDWEINSKSRFGSGASEKLWITNPVTNKKGIFKYPKIKSNGEITGEYWSEKMSSEIGKLIKMKCADVDIGIYNREKRVYEL